MSDAVIEVFVRLYRDGLIYRGNRMVNWDPLGKQLFQMKKLYTRK